MFKRKSKYVPDYGGGIPVGYDERKQEYLYERLDYHSGIEGVTGIGKTTRFFIPAVYIMGRLKENMIIADNKLQVYFATKKFLESQGYDVLMVNYREPELGHRINMMSEIIMHIENGDLDSAQMEAVDLAATLVPRSDNGEPMWGDGSESAIASVMLALCMRKDIPDSAKTVSNVFHNIIHLGKSEKDGSLLDDYFSMSERSHIEKIAYGNYGMSSSKVRMSFNTMATSSIREFSYERIKRQSAVNDFDLRKMVSPGSKPFVIFVVAPDEKDSLNRLAPSFYEYAYRVTVDESNKLNGTKLPIRLHMMLDEFTNNGKFKNFVQRLTLSRGRNIFYHLGYQSQTQIQSVYGDKDADTIVRNLGVRAFTEFGDQEDIDDFQKKTGFSSVVGSTQSENQRGLLDLSLNKNTFQYQAKKVPLFDRHYLTTLGIPDAIIKRRSMFAFKTFLPVWMETPLTEVLEPTLYKDLSKRVDDELIYEKLLIDPIGIQNVTSQNVDDTEPVDYEKDSENNDDVDLPDSEYY